MLKSKLTTARRRGDELCGISLFKRRAWFSEDGKIPDAQPAPQNLANPSPDVPDWVRDPVKAYEEIRNLRAEAKETRLLLDGVIKKQGDGTQQKPATDTKLADDLAKTQQQLSDMQKRLQEKEANELRLKVALEMGLPAALADRLKGDNEEALRKDGETLKALIPAQQPPKPGQSTTPVPGGTPVGETDAQKRARLIGKGGTAPIFDKK